MLLLGRTGLRNRRRTGDDEAITIFGALQFARYSGYGHGEENGLRFAGPFMECGWRSAAGRGVCFAESDWYRRWTWGPQMGAGTATVSPTAVVALDALPDPGAVQFMPQGVARELRKAMVAFHKFDARHVYRTRERDEHYRRPTYEYDMHPIGITALYDSI